MKQVLSRHYINQNKTLKYYFLNFTVFSFQLIFVTAYLSEYLV